MNLSWVVLAFCWIYGRIGQIACFSLGALLLLVGAYGAFYGWEAIVAGGGFLATGLVLKVIFHWRRLHETRR